MMFHSGYIILYTPSQIAYNVWKCSILPKAQNMKEAEKEALMKNHMD